MAETEKRIIIFSVDNPFCLPYFPRGMIGSPKRLEVCFVSLCIHALPKARVLVGL